METVKVKELLKYKSVIEANTMFDITSAMLSGAKTINVPIGTMYELKRRLQVKKEEDKILADCVKRNNRGSTFEKAGKISSAIKVYEANIGIDCYPAHHSFKRLMVLYHKRKDYENELRVINLALQRFPNDINYIERYNKTLKLLGIEGEYSKKRNMRLP